jgi:uncharacterized protein (DUF1919 family)
VINYFHHALFAIRSNTFSQRNFAIELENLFISSSRAAQTEQVTDGLDRSPYFSFEADKH